MTEKTTVKQDEGGLAARPPIVVVMGHIDHGKTKILDWYRKTKVVESESGGITQHIGAYEVKHKDKTITFIDTPGHEAFSKLRGRGAKVADIAILVVAADEGVKPQTKEAIEIIRQNNLPFVVALNKVDKPEANPERVKKQLAEENVLVESYGGKTPLVEISAKVGQNMEELLEMLLLVAELENLTSHPGALAEGVVVEANLDARRGNTATLLVRDGTLRKGDVLVVGDRIETIKIFEDFMERPIKEAGPSSPARITGLSEVPAAGEIFRAFSSKGAAEKYIEGLEAEKKSPPPPHAPASGEEQPTFNLLLKADVAGSAEALEDALKKIKSEPVKINIIRSGVGDINESDVKRALATKMVTIIGFKVGVDASVRALAEQSNVRIITGEVIYELLDETKKKIEEMIPPEIRKTILGRAKILKVFKQDGAQQIVGGRVEEGVIKKGVQAEVQRRKENVGRGSILQLQQNKQDVDEVQKGTEFGIMIDSSTAIEEGDVLEIFQEEVIKRGL